MECNLYSVEEVKKIAEQNSISVTLVSTFSGVLSMLGAIYWY